MGFEKAVFILFRPDVLKISFRMVVTISIAGYVIKKVKWYVVMYVLESITKVACRVSDHFLITRNSFVQNVQKFRTPRIRIHVSKVWKMCRYQETFIKIADSHVTTIEGCHGVNKNLEILSIHIAIFFSLL